MTEIVQDENRHLSDIPYCRERVCNNQSMQAQQCAPNRLHPPMRPSKHPDFIELERHIVDDDDEMDDMVSEDEEQRGGCLTKSIAERLSEKRKMKRFRFVW